jgi:hypothetical protein
MEGGMKKAVKRRVGRPAGRASPRRPVIATRVHQSVFDEITEAAAAAGRNVSEELIWRAVPSNLEAVLLSRNWKKVHGANFGAANCISPDNPPYPKNDFIDPKVAAEPLNKQIVEGTIDRIVKRFQDTLSDVVTRAVKTALAERGPQ